MKRLWGFIKWSLWYDRRPNYLFLIIVVVSGFYIFTQTVKPRPPLTLEGLDRRLQSVEAQVDSIKTVVWQDGYTTAMCEAIEIVKEYKAGLLNAADTLPAVKP